MAVDLERAEHGDTHAPTVDLIPIPVNGTVTGLTPRPARGRHRPGAPLEAKGENHATHQERSRGPGRDRSPRLCGNDDEAGTGSDKAGDKAGEEPTTSATQPDYQTLSGRERLHRPGRWAVPADDSPETPLAVIDVPTAGFNGGARWIWTNKAVIGYWTVAGVYKDPCSRSGAVPSAGDTVEDLARALDAQKLTTATEAVPVTVDGHDGLYLQVSTPAELDYGTCLDDGLVIFDDAAAWSEPVATRFWILDVDGQRVVLTLNGDEATEKTDRVFTGMVETATFETGPSS